MRIYIVWGACGSYSDREEWIVRAFSTKAAATAHAEKCQGAITRIADRLKKANERNDDNAYCDAGKAAQLNRLDRRPYFSSDIAYTVGRCWLVSR